LRMREEADAEHTSERERILATQTRIEEREEFRRLNRQREYQESRIAGEQLAQEERTRIEEREERQRTRRQREYQESRIAGEELAQEQSIAQQQSFVDELIRIEEASYAERERIRQQEIEDQEAFAKALERATNFALSLSGNFNSAISNFSNQIATAFGNMLTGVGNSLEQMAKLAAAGAVAFTSAIGEMIGAAITGEEGIGSSLAKAALSLIQQMATMVIATHVTAVVMGTQAWNPVLMALGVAGAIAATAGLSVLASMGADTSQRQADTSTDTSTGTNLGMRDVTARDVGASFGRAPQGVQLAVAVPLMDAANMFGSHVDTFGSYVGRLVTEGITVDVGAASRTAALR